MRSYKCDCYMTVSTTYYTVSTSVLFYAHEKVLAFINLSFFICSMAIIMPFMFKSHVLFLRIE